MTQMMMAFFQLFSKAFWTESNWLAPWGNLPFQRKDNTSSQTTNTSVSGSSAPESHRNSAGLHLSFNFVGPGAPGQKKKKDNSSGISSSALSSPRATVQSLHLCPTRLCSSATNVKTRSRLRSILPWTRGPRGAGTKTSENTGGGGEMGRHVIF